MSLTSILFWSGGLFVGLYLLSFVMVTHRFLRMRIVAARFEQAPDDTLPEPVRALLARGVDELVAHGFEPEALTWMHGPLAGAPPSPGIWLVHRERSVWALLGPALMPTPSCPLRLALVSYFADGSSLSSVSGEAWALYASVPGERVLDQHRLAWADQLADHLRALPENPAAPLALSFEELRQRLQASSLGMARSLVPFTAPEGTYGLSWRTAARLALRALFPSEARRVLTRERARLPPWPEVDDALPWLQDHVCKTGDALLEAPVRPGLAWFMFALTALLFGVSMLVFGPFGFVVQLSLVLLVHELGHWSAMRLFGYREPSIFFVPFLGAATTGTKHDANLMQRLVVLAAGAVPGVVAGTLALVLLPALDPALKELAGLAITVNAANLLPIVPLDGGRIVQQLVTQQRPWLDVALALLSTALLVVLGVITGEPVLFVIALLTALQIRVSFEVARLAARLAPTAGTSHSARSLAVWTALQASKLKPAQKMLVARRSIARLSEPTSSARQRAVGLVAYLALLVATLGAITVYARNGRDGRREAELVFDCHADGGAAGATLLGFPEDSRQLRCDSASRATIETLQAETAFKADLPINLCLRERWLPAAAGDAAREARAHRQVTALARVVEAEHVYKFDESHSPEQMRAGWLADLRRGLAGVEQHIARAERDATTDLDMPTAQAYAAYLRAMIANVASEQEDELPEERALSELLGRGQLCPTPYTVYNTRVRAKGAQLVINLTGDARSLAQHMCQAGCDRLLVTPAQPELAPIKL